jgi:hypothetical protein
MSTPGKHPRYFLTVLFVHDSDYQLPFDGDSALLLAASHIEKVKQDPMTSGICLSRFDERGRMVPEKQLRRSASGSWEEVKG